MKTFQLQYLEVMLTSEELTSYFKIFGDKFWNDTENQVFIPIGNLREEDDFTEFFDKVCNFFGTINLDLINGIYIDCNNLLVESPS